MLAFSLSLDDLVIASFTTGPGATTLPIRIYSEVRLGVKPEINAVCTIMIAVVALGTIAASLIAKRGAMRRGAPPSARCDDSRLRDARGSAAALRPLGGSTTARRPGGAARRWRRAAGGAVPVSRSMHRADGVAARCVRGRHRAAARPRPSGESAPRRRAA